jgi:V/A-type H+-transporting ATPase subunit E
MALENILQSIEERRNRELERISRDYMQRIEHIEKETQQRLDALQNEYRRKTAEDSKSLENRELSNADIEARRIVRERRSQLVEASLGKAYEIMDGLSASSDYKDIVDQMVKTSRNMLGKDCVIRIGESGAQFIKEGRGKKVVVEEVDPLGGLIADSSDGTMELDLTFTTLKKELKDRLMLEIAAKFGAE